MSHGSAGRLTELRVEGSVMALEKDTFLLAAFRNDQKIGKRPKSNAENQQQSRIFAKKSVHENWKRLEGSRWYERFLVSILPP